MTVSKRFILSFAIVALFSSPALLADDAVDAPSAFEVLLQAVVEILTPVPDLQSAQPVDENQAGPNIIFIG